MLHGHIHSPSPCDMTVDTIWFKVGQWVEGCTTISEFCYIASAPHSVRLPQEHIKAVKLVREHVTTIDGEIQTWWSDANLVSIKLVVSACNNLKWN